MRLELTEAQRRERRRAAAFVAETVAPHAGRWDREEALPRSLVGELAAAGWLASILPPEARGDAAGGGLDPIAYGLVTEEVAKGCSSTRSLLTVHDMVARAIWRWGDDEQKRRHLPALAAGETLGALALSEPGAGSDAGAIATRAEPDGDGWRLTGVKRWTTVGQLADLYLVFARVEDEGPTAFLLPRTTAGLRVEPIRGVAGTRASMLAELTLDGCRLGPEALLGRPGLGLSHVGFVALQHGRYSVAWGGVGIAQACLEASRDRAADREQFGHALEDHQLIRAMLTDMEVQTRAARLLCCRAGWLEAEGDPGATAEIMAAKYLASRVATKAALDAVQIHGAAGLTDEYPVERHLRDSRVLEIIEGSTQIQQISIPRMIFSDL